MQLNNKDPLNNGLSYDKKLCMKDVTYKLHVLEISIYCKFTLTDQDHMLHEARRHAALPCRTEREQLEGGFQYTHSLGMKCRQI